MEHHTRPAPPRAVKHSRTAAHLGTLCVAARQRALADDGRLRRLVAFVVAAHDAEAITGRIGKHHPPRAIFVAPVGNLACSEFQDAIDLGVASAISGGNIEVDSTRRLMKSIAFDEQQALVAVRVEDHALLIPRFVGIVA